MFYVFYSLVHLSYFVHILCLVCVVPRARCTDGVISQVFIQERLSPITAGRAGGEGGQGGKSDGPDGDTDIRGELQSPQGDVKLPLLTVDVFVGVKKSHCGVTGESPTQNKPVSLQLQQRRNQRPQGGAGRGGGVVCKKTKVVSVHLILLVVFGVLGNSSALRSDSPVLTS